MTDTALCDISEAPRTEYPRGPSEAQVELLVKAVGWWGERTKTTEQRRLKPETKGNQGTLKIKGFMIV